MIDETKKGVKKSNKIKVGFKRSILDRVLISFADTLRSLKQKINFSTRLFLNLKDSLSFKYFSSGYVLILMVIALPILLYGAKYLLDHRTLLDRNVINPSSEDKRLVKFCAEEAAQAVAAKWNPALTYGQQREAMLRIADEIYNAAPTYEDSPITQALHGIDIPKEEISEGGTYDPKKRTRVLNEEKGLSPSLKQIARSPQTTNMNRYYFYYYYSTRKAPMALYHFYIMYDSLKRINSNLFPPDEDLYQDYAYYCGKDSEPLGASWYHYVTWPEVVGMSNKDGSRSVGTKSYTTRTDLDDETVKIEIEDDKIKVTTDDDVAYAVPAECNVDIILTVPTNSAALNPDNLDKNTPTSGTSYISTSTTPTDEAKSTPIYQITRAYQKFLKDNFFYTRGVNVGVIPYSGKVSLRADRSAWVKDPDSFVSTYFLNGSYQPMIMGSMMYGTKGTADANLTSMGDSGGYGYYGYGLLCRGETQSYNGNKITLGDLLSTKNPKDYKFRKMIYNPCYVGYANLLSMKCEKDCDKYWMNPYFILELNPDVKFIYNMLGAFYPYYDDRNVSNFIFIPVSWANNLLQDWSATGKNSAVNTSEDPDDCRLSTPSKGTKADGRKKALILIVNKPDWFEPGELTYLGFDNDYSEVPMYESDCIGGDIDYSDTTQNFADGSSYDRTIQGAKKILKLKKVSGDDLVRKNGFYECKNGKYRLTFPEKQAVKLQVASGSENAQVKFVAIASSSSNAAYSVDGINWESATLPFSGGWKSVCYGNGKFVAVSGSGGIAYSTDGINWESATLPSDFSSDSQIYSVCYGNGKFVAIIYGGRKYLYSTDGITWESSAMPYASWYSVCHENDKFVAISLWYGEGAYITDSLDGNWTTFNFNTPNSVHWQSVCYGNDKFVAVADSSRSAYSIDGISWEVIDSSSNSRYSSYSVCYGNNRFVTICSNKAAYSTDGISWEVVDLPFSGNWQSVCYGDGKFVATSSNKDWDKKNVIYSTDGINWEQATVPTAGYWSLVCYGNTEAKPSPGFLQFTSSSVLSDTDKKTITSEETFIITPDKINGSSDGGYFIEFEMENIKLISAEITNRPLPDTSSITATYVNNVKYTSESDSIDFSSGRTQGDKIYLRYEDYNGSTTYDNGLGRICDDDTVKGRLYFPYKGTVKLEVEPEISAGSTNSRSVIFYKDGIGDDYDVEKNGSAVNIGESYPYTVPSDGLTFTFKGGTDPEGSYKNVSSTRGSNFGHNLSPYKVKYKCVGCKITSATLTNQYLRDYIGQYGRDNATSYKQLILSDGTLASKYSSGCAYTVMNTYENVRDAHSSAATTDGDVSEDCDHSSHHSYWQMFRDYPVVQISNLSKMNINYSREEYITSQDKDSDSYRYRYHVYGLHAPYTVYSCTYNKGSIPLVKFADGDYSYGEHEISAYRGKGWGNCVIPSSETPWSQNHNGSYSYQDITKDGHIIQTYWKNGRTFSLASTDIYDTLPSSDFNKNIAIYLAKLNSDLSTAITAGNYICFFGDGDLSVTVEPSFPKVKINGTSMKITDKTTLTFSDDQINGSEGSYYVEFEMEKGIRLLSASYSYSPAEADGTNTESVYDVIDFASGLNGKNGILSASSGWNGSVSNGLYVVNSKSSARITASKRGRIHLVVAPAIESKRGTIDYTSNGYYHGRGILSKTTITIGAEELVSSGSSYYVDIGAEGVVILYAKWEPNALKLALPKRSQYIDYSKDPLECYQTSTNDEFFKSWEYNANNGYWTNKDNLGNWSVLYNVLGDYTAIAYGDKPYEALRYHANGANPDYSYGNYDQFNTAGLNRIFVDWENRPDSVKNYGFMWSKYRNRNPGSLYWMIGASTLPINASLWKPVGAFRRSEDWEKSESAVYYDSHYQLDQQGNYKYSTIDVLPSITAEACSKLKNDWGEDLRIYVIEYRKQTKYKTERGVELNYYYNNVDSCASNPWRAPYMYDISTPDELNEALGAIAQNIKNWPDVWR